MRRQSHVYRVEKTRGQDIDVFSYLDYRSFLRDYYHDKKARGRGFSYRSFSRRAGLKSPNYLKLVIDGERNLSAGMAERFAEACGLKDDDARYFVDLVAFNQASTSSERNKHYARLTGFRRYRKAHKLDVAHAAYYSAWFMPAVRELAASPEFEADPDWIAKQMVPKITKTEAASALSTLLELGLLVKDEDGKVVQSEALLSTGPETEGVHIGNYHRAMMERAVASIDLLPPDDRDISSLTLCLGEGGLHAFKERIQRFRRELLELSALEDDPEQVIQVNFQLFPLTKGRGGNGS
jgi:uncharacterized protein (TIGR02147 family)